MATPQLPDADTLTGDERISLRQAGRARGLLFSVWRDWLMGTVQTAITAALTPVLTRVSVLESAGAAQAARDTAQDTTLAQEATARQAADAAEVIARQAVATALATETSTRQAADTSEVARLAALEAKPEEAAHFTATAAVPAVSILGGGTVTLTNLTPARAGDVLKVGEEIVVRPAVALPNGLGIAAARVTADNTVVVQLVTSIAISAGASIAWNITALR